MKSLSAHLNESLNEGKTYEVKNKTLGQLISWMNGYGPEGKKPEEKAPDKDKYDCEGPFDNGGFDDFKTEKEMYNFVISNKNKVVTIKVIETRYDFECNITLGDKNFSISSAYEPFSEIN